MTVCVAAMCEQANIVVGAADRMLTSGDIEFEPPQTKMINLTSSIVGLIAGDAAFQIGIMNKVRVDVEAHVKKSPTVWLTVEALSRMYEHYYVTIRRNLAENRILAPLGLDITTFIEKQRTMNSQLVQKLASEIVNFDVPETAAIFAGVDEGGAHIYTVRNGIGSCDDVVGFSAIGAGANHADSQLMFSAHAKWNNFPNTLLTVYTAKKRSEVAPGVGEATDMFYIGPTLGSYTSIGGHVLEKLEEIYKEEQKKQKEARAKSLEQTNDYLEELAKSAIAKEQSETPKDAGTPASTDSTGTIGGGAPAKDEPQAKG